MSATIHLTGCLGFNPSSLLVWHRNDDSQEEAKVKPPVNREIILDEFQEMIAGYVQGEVPEHEANGGLEQGRPDLSLSRGGYAATCCQKERSSRPERSRLRSFTMLDPLKEQPQTRSSSCALAVALKKRRCIDGTLALAMRFALIIVSEAQSALLRWLRLKALRWELSGWAACYLSACPSRGLHESGLKNALRLSWVVSPSYSGRRAEWA